MYKEFTTSQLHPSGGAASLRLLVEPEEIFNAEEAGIKYSVQPPGKKVCVVVVGKWVGGYA